MKGEALASQCEHADNLAPAIFGGFTLVKSACPLHVLELPTPPDLYATLIHPQIEIKTVESRAILPKDIPLDPWGKAYIYKTPGDNGNLYTIMSYGLDGQPGGTDENADVIHK